MKVMSKKLLFKMDEIRHILTERDILTTAKRGKTKKRKKSKKWRRRPNELSKMPSVLRTRR